MITCTNPAHDHTTTEDGHGGTLAEPVPMRCQHCKSPAHYDSGAEDYDHDDAATPPCFLISGHPYGATPCTSPDRQETAA